MSLKSKIYLYLKTEGVLQLFHADYKKNVNKKNNNFFGGDRIIILFTISICVFSFS